MVGAKEQPCYVRHDQPHEPGQPTHRDRRAGEQRSYHQQRKLSPLHVYAQVGSLVLAQEERIEVTRQHSRAQATERDERDHDL